MKSTLDAIDVCSEAHQRDPRNANILQDRAEAYILNQEYEKGEKLAPVQSFIRTEAALRYDEIRSSFVLSPHKCSPDTVAVSF